MKGGCDEGAIKWACEFVSGLWEERDTAHFCVGRNAIVYQDLMTELKSLKPRCHIMQRRLEPSDVTILECMRVKDAGVGALDLTEWDIQICKTRAAVQALKCGPRKYLPGHTALLHLKDIPMLKKAQPCLCSDFCCGLYPSICLCNSILFVEGGSIVIGLSCVSVGITKSQYGQAELTHFKRAEVEKLFRGVTTADKYHRRNTKVLDMSGPSDAAHEIPQQDDTPPDDMDEDPALVAEKALHEPTIPAFWMEYHPKVAPIVVRMHTFQWA